jgi:hypothetical protein
LGTYVSEDQNLPAAGKNIQETTGSESTSQLTCVLWNLNNQKKGAWSIIRKKLVEFTHTCIMQAQDLEW